jgi:hypothetical protein
LSAVSAAGAFCMTEWGRREQRPWRKWSLAAASAVLVLLAISIFQPGAMFFWVFAAIVIFTPDATIRCLLRRLLWYGTIVGTGMVLGFGIYEWSLAHYRRGLALYGADSIHIFRALRLCETDVSADRGSGDHCRARCGSFRDHASGSA